ncbi:citrate/2-methylcitrate synthase [Chitinimonas koreensis]|uniref:citrate/2-methylcitrate synthase n=1 Tax=Chitinimonas koreensis TaxID=356302 RepID=UPI00054F6160|nr:citrate/2-methylcitrate synthase [Chitinimonas koreensis]
MPEPAIAPHLTAAEAAALLGVSRQTLYAYVSRGLLRAQPADDPRERRYAREEVEQLAGRRARGRQPREVARATLDWGLPVLASAITLIEDGRLHYRGEPAERLAATATLEQVAALLWQCDAAAAFAPAAPALPPDWLACAEARAAQPLSERLPTLLALAASDADSAIWQRDPQRVAAAAGALLRLVLACVLGRPPSAEALHLQCGEAWRLDAAGAELVRRALVLCADHELNASSFTARCVASTGASLKAAVLAGLAALSGGRHGGATARVEAWWDELDRAGGAAADDVPADSVPADYVGVALHARLARGDGLPGFGHPLYPHGDPRAQLLLAQILPQRPAWRTMLEAAERLTGGLPSIDVALVALRRHLGLPRDAAFGLFAAGRTAGWIAHALEQRGEPGLIRPRAAYVGPPPAGT